MRRMNNNQYATFFGRVVSAIVIAVFCAICLIPTPALAAIPATINYHSRLRDSNSDPVTTATDISFALYTAASGGSAVWSETYDQNSGACTKITPDAEGYFSLALGSCTAISGVNFTNPVYLGVTIGTDPEATPRVMFNPAPYALNADAVDGFSASSTATANQLLALDGSLNFNINTGAFTGDSITLGSVSKSSSQALMTLQNTAGDFQFFQTAASPVGVLTGSVGDIAVDSTNGNLYFKSSGTSSTSGWSVVMTEANLNANNAISVNSGGTGLYSRGLSGTGNSPANSIFLGVSAGASATSASNSNFLGNSAGNGATNAGHSNFFGNFAGDGATNASYSNFFGRTAGRQATNASYSNLFGFQAGRTFTGNNIGANNIIIGTNISLPNAAANSINIGGVLFGTNTYSTTSGDSSITPASGGRIGIGVVAPSATLHINGDMLIGGSSRYLNFNTTAGSSGYGFRDNAGTMEFKDSGGSWAAFGGGGGQWTETSSGLSYAGKGLDTGWSNTSTLFSLSGTTDFGNGETSQGGARYFARWTVYSFWYA